MLSLRRPLTDPGYDPAEREEYERADAEWRARSHGTGGPLRTRTGQMAAVPAHMRLDIQTNRRGPWPLHKPVEVLGRYPDLGQCWVFTGALTNGYGYVRVGKRKVQGYRVNFERWVGEIPDGTLLDHLCRVRSCVRPDHVVPSTWLANVLRSPVHTAALNAARLFCPEGHAYNDANTYVSEAGGRRCRKCDAARKRQRTGAEERVMADDECCAQGHPWPQPRGRNCPVCNRAAGRAFRERQRARG